MRTQLRHLIAGITTTMLVLLAFVRPAFAWEELPEDGTLASAIRLVLLGRFGGFALGIIGMAGVYCLIFGAGKGTDQKNDGTLLFGMFCMALVIALSWYRFSSWKNTIGMAQ